MDVGLLLYGRSLEDKISLIQGVEKSTSCKKKKIFFSGAPPQGRSL
jgi:hypothetical protein